MSSYIKFFANQIYNKMKAGEDPKAVFARMCPADKYSEAQRNAVWSEYQHRAARKVLRELDELKPRYHCQICEREHKSVRSASGKDVLAHHGYSRPGLGWQTPSCYGARKLPWEESCEAIPPYIAMVEAHQQRMRAACKDAVANPPKEYKIARKFDVNQPDRPPIVYTRPEGFDPQACLRLGAVAARTYEAEFRHLFAMWTLQAANATLEIKRMKDRYCSHRKADKRTKMAFAYGATAGKAAKISARKGATR